MVGSVHTPSSPSAPGRLRGVVVISLDAARLARQTLSELDLGPGGNLYALVGDDGILRAGWAGVHDVDWQVFRRGRERAGAEAWGRPIPVAAIPTI